MRIISQDTNKSVNMDMVALYVEYETIIALAPNGSEITLSKYKTEERTSEVFRALHDANTDGFPEYYMPID